MHYTIESPNLLLPCFASKGSISREYIDHTCCHSVYGLLQMMMKTKAQAAIEPDVLLDSPSDMENPEYAKENFLKYYKEGATQLHDIAPST